MAQINPNKLVTDLRIQTGVHGQLELYWDLPVDFVDGEEIVVARRKDAFPVELNNPNYEDRYSDVVQIESFRGFPIYCSDLEVDGFTLNIGGGNVFSPLSVTDFEVDNKYTGRLIRDSISQVFRIVSNTESTITVENISSNEDNQIVPTNGAFVILADFNYEVSDQLAVELIPNSNTVTVVTNTFNPGDKITVNSSFDLEYLVDWVNGATVNETARNIASAINSTGLQFTVEVYDNVILVEKAEENTLAIVSNTASISVNPYSACQGIIFVQDGRFSKNQLRNLAIEDFNADRYFIKSNEGKAIRLYKSNVVGNGFFTIFSSHSNSFARGFIDSFKNYVEALTKEGTGLEDEKYYYYTLFNTPVRSIDVMLNEQTSLAEDLSNYTVDKIDDFITRIAYEDLSYTNTLDVTFSYNSLTGDVTYSPAVDFTEYGIQVGDFIVDADGRRSVILDISNAATGILGIATSALFSTEQRSRLHGSIAIPTPPVNMALPQVGDTFKDLAGYSFPIVGTFTNPLISVVAGASNTLDVIQGLIDDLIFSNDYLVHYSYNPQNGLVQYGEEVITLNKLLSAFNYNSISGIAQYSGGTINLTQVEVGDYLVDGASNLWEIKEVNHDLQQVTLNTGLAVINTVVTSRDGSVIRYEGITDVDGNLLVNLSSVNKFDLFKTSSKATYTILDIDTVNGTLTIESGLEAISTTVDSIHDGSVLRRGRDIAWTGFEDELDETLTSTSQGGVRRYGSVSDTQFAVASSNLNTQIYAIHAEDRAFGKYLYDLWPGVFRNLDATEDLQDLMDVFGTTFNELYSLINTYELQNADLINHDILAKAHTSYGLGTISETLGIDTRRRVMRDLISAYKLKGNREGIAKFIKILTTWDITNGTNDLREAIIDDTPESVGLRFYSPSLGSSNTNLVDTINVESPPAGRFYKGIPGLSLPGFFSYIEVIINLPNVAWEIGNSDALVIFQGQSTLSDGTANFGQVNSLVGAYIIPDEGSPNDFFRITANTATTITVDGIIPSDRLGAKYIVLSPLNLERFLVLNNTIEEFMPYNTIAVFNFTISG